MVEHLRIQGDCIEAPSPVVAVTLATTGARHLARKAVITATISQVCGHPVVTLQAQTVLRRLVERAMAGLTLVCQIGMIIDQRPGHENFRPDVLELGGALNRMGQRH